jgi:hypothetical protein
MSRFSAFARRAPARSGAEGDVPRARTRGPRRGGRGLDEDRHPRAEPGEISAGHVDLDAEGHPWRAAPDRLRDRGDGSDPGGEPAIREGVGDDDGGLSGADLAVVDVEEERVDAERTGVGDPGEREAGPERVARQELLPLARVLGDDEDAVLRRVERQRGHRRLELVALGARPLEGDELRGAVGLGRRAVAGELLLGLVELRPRAAERELLLLVVAPRAELPGEVGVEAGLLEVGRPGADGLLPRELRDLRSASKRTSSVSASIAPIRFCSSSEARFPASNSATRSPAFTAAPSSSRKRSWSSQSGVSGTKRSAERRAASSPVRRSGRRPSASGVAGRGPSPARAPRQPEKRSRRPAGAPPRARAGRVVPVSFPALFYGGRRRTVAGTG